jgi:signal transduction histidine kinase
LVAALRRYIEVPKEQRPIWVRYLTAVLFVLGALILRLFLLPFTGTGVPFVLFFGAVLTSSLYGGPFPGLLATALSAPIGAYFFVIHSDYSTSQAVFQAAVFVAECMLVVWISSALQRSVQKAEKNAAAARVAENEAKRLAAEAQRATQMRDDLVAIVSHDLKNPLATIDLAASRLLSEFPEDGSATATKTTQAVKTIKNSSLRMKRLIDDLLDLAKIEGGHFLIESRPIDSSALIKEALENLEPLVRQKSIRMEFDAGSDPCFVEGDRDRIFQVLSNLLGNAIKFSAEGGLVRLRVRKKNQRAEFEISDMGPGIPERQIPYLFDRFWQARQTSRQGTGLGLSIAKGIIDAHGGEIWAQSRIGEGSTFYFTLRLAESTGPMPMPMDLKLE